MKQMKNLVMIKIQLMKIKVYITLAEITNNIAGKLVSAQTKMHEKIQLLMNEI